jgi:adenine-specific DNA-methyltransferase
MPDVNKQSPNIITENQEWLKEKFPSCFVEGKLDFEKLKELLSEITDTRDEKYSFSWAGRSNSIKNIQTPSNGTLISDKEESINFDDTENILIDGENLEVLKLLQKSYSGKIKMIYIDPPYNTGHDFIYKDNFSNSLESYLEQTGQSKTGIKQTTLAETSGRFHSDWISFMYPRLFLARDLLKEDGIIFVSIDHGEIHNLRNIMNEIFGEDNFITDIIWQKKYSRQNDATYFSDNHEYVLCFAKNKSNCKINLLPRTEKQNDRYKNPDNDPRGLWMSDNLTVKTYSKEYDYTITTPSGRKIDPPNGLCWRISKIKLSELIKDNRISFGLDGKNTPRLKRFLNEVKDGLVPVTLWLREDVGDTQEGVREFNLLMPDAKFDNPKPTKLIQLMLQLTTCDSSHDIVLDFFAGSGTTGDGLLDLNYKNNGNRKFILIQLPEMILKDNNNFNQNFTTISDICKERLHQKSIHLKEQNKQQKSNKFQNLDLGFKVFKLAKSNYKTWEDVKDETKLKDQLKLFEDPLIEKHKDIDVIYEIILKEGYSLNSKIKEISAKPNKIYKVSDDDFFFYVTLDKQVNSESIDNLKLDDTVMFVCLDSAIGDSQKTNLSKICKLRTI